MHLLLQKRSQKTSIIKRNFRLFTLCSTRELLQNGRRRASSTVKKNVIITLQIHYNLILRNKLVGTSFDSTFFRFVSVSPLFCFPQFFLPLPFGYELNLNNFPLFSSPSFFSALCRKNGICFIARRPLCSGIVLKMIHFKALSGARTDGNKRHFTTILC